MNVSCVVMIRLPASYPLRTVEVQGVSTAGMAEAEWRRILLSMTALLHNQVRQLWEYAGVG